LSFRERILTLLLALAICPYFIDLGGSAIWDANEAFYVETPREMMERGDYISPTFNYEPRLNKPVLSYWVVAGVYHLFGVSVGVQRLPIAIGAIVMIVAAFVLALAAAPVGTGAADSRRRVEAALWSALGLASTPRLLMFSRRIIIDVFIAMFMALALMCFALSERYPERRRRYLVWMYVAIGLGVLTKGPIAILLPGAVFAGYLLVHRELGRVRSMMLPAGTLIVAAIIVPWYAALYVRDGWEPIKSFIIGENVARYTEGLGVDAIRPFWFYAPVIFSDSFPWSLFLIPAAAAWFAGRRTAGDADPARRVRTLLWLWIVVIVLFFTASAAKQDLYIYPIVPAVTALAGITIAHGLRERSRALRWTASVIGVVVAIAGAGVLYLVGSPTGTYVVEGSRIMGVAGVVGGLSILVLAIANRSALAVVGIAITFIVLNWGFVLRVLPGFERYKPVPGFAATLEPRLQERDRVVTFDEALPSLVFYLRRHVDPIFIEQELFDAFRAGGTVYAVLSTENYREVVDRIGVPTCEIERRPTFDVKLRNMIARQPLPELVLITNRCP
jgi:4-amino-4-deoxy-L-arabinose transferase-like glycosyltransferase